MFNTNPSETTVVLVAGIGLAALIIDVVSRNVTVVRPDGSHKTEAHR